MGRLFSLVAFFCSSPEFSNGQAGRIFSSAAGQGRGSLFDVNIRQTETQIPQRKIPQVVLVERRWAKPKAVRIYERKMFPALKERVCLANSEKEALFGNHMFRKVSPTPQHTNPNASIIVN